MNKFFKYLLKGKREEFSLPVILGRLILLVIVICFSLIVTFLAMLHCQGKREHNALLYLGERCGNSAVVYSPISILPDPYSSLLAKHSSEWFYFKTYYMHTRVIDLTIHSTEVVMTIEDVERIGSFKYLERLEMDYSQVNDISPLKGLNLKILLLDSTQIADLSPLKGMPLEKLQIANTRVTDLSPLEDSSIEWLGLGGCNSINDLKPLMSCNELESVVLPEEIGNVEYLKKHPKLEYFRKGYYSDWQKKDVFWEEYDAKKKR